WGRRWPSSPKQNAPISATTPPTIHAVRTSVGDPPRCATVADVRKIPPPMIPPITAIVPENRPSRRAEVVMARENGTNGAVRTAAGAAPAQQPIPLPSLGTPDQFSVS